MTWNRPIEREQGTGNREQGTGKSPFRGLVAGAVVVLVATVAAWLLWPTGRRVTDTASAEKPALIKEVKPSAAPTKAPVEKKYSKMTRDEKLQWYKDRYGDNLPDNLKPVVYFLENPPERKFTPGKGKADFLKHTSERQVASLMLAEPGARFALPPRLHPNFDKDFAAALNEPIEILPDDSESVRETKLAVESFKKEISEISKAEGRKPREIVEEYATALYQLGAYRQNLEKQVKAFRDNPDYSDADVDDFFTAANEMLRAKGLPELKNKSLISRSVRLRALQKRAEHSTVKENSHSQKEK